MSRLYDLALNRGETKFSRAALALLLLVIGTVRESMVRSSWRYDQRAMLARRIVEHHSTTAIRLCRI